MSILSILQEIEPFIKDAAPFFSLIIGGTYTNMVEEIFEVILHAFQVPNEQKEQLVNTVKNNVDKNYVIRQAQDDYLRSKINQLNHTL